MAFIVPSNTLVRDYEFIAPSDPALDRDDPDFENKYRIYTDHGDASVLPLKPAQEPTRFVMRHIVGRVAETLLGLLQECQTDEYKSLAVLFVAAQYGVKGVKNLPTAEGGDFKLLTVKDKDSGAPKLSEESMAKLKAAGPSLVYELGDRVIRSMVAGPLS